MKMSLRKLLLPFAVISLTTSMIFGESILRFDKNGYAVDAAIQAHYFIKYFGDSMASELIENAFNEKIEVPIRGVIMSNIQIDTFGQVINSQIFDTIPSFFKVTNEDMYGFIEYLKAEKVKFYLQMDPWDIYRNSKYWPYLKFHEYDVRHFEMLSIVKNNYVRILAIPILVFSRKYFRFEEYHEYAARFGKDSVNVKFYDFYKYYSDSLKDLPDYDRPENVYIRPIGYRDSIKKFFNEKNNK